MANSPLKTFPLNNQFISSINYKTPEDQLKNEIKPSFIVVLDRSGSMRDSVRRIVTEILPIMFQKLGYEPTDNIHLVTFSDDDEYHLLQVNQLTAMTNFDQGGTNMFPAVFRLREIFQNFQSNGIEVLRILAISDGLISDQDKTEASASELAKFAKSFSIAINSQAIRWEQPSADTRALCSLLQLNNVKSAQMVDTKLITPNEDIAELWAQLFMDDQLTSGTTLTSKCKVFLKNPWDEEATEKIRLQDGSNTVWMTQVPNDMKVDGAKVDVNDGGELNYEKLYELMKEKYKYVVNQMKVHKIVSTKESITIMHRIVTYFRRVEIEVKVPAGTKKFSSLLEDIANDRKVAYMSPEELKAYLEPKDIKNEFKPTKSENPKQEVKPVTTSMTALTPEQLVEVIKSFEATSVMVLLLKQPENEGNCNCNCKCNCLCHFKSFNNQ
ncbi:hypothetical protein PVAND_015686 [Polypedilum vanderplanki]|uniref:VWFA domain-containing protein n=1 Tax=Polypedilum vanderplanki TaxID=319348 RepID=A0A9J6BDW6_POLVA|nr:hypothetical protein PVAND_015686 [Polypedilum vanderplanki]